MFHVLLQFMKWSLSSNFVCTSNVHTKKPQLKFLSHYHWYDLFTLQLGCRSPTLVPLRPAVTPSYPGVASRKLWAGQPTTQKGGRAGERCAAPNHEARPKASTGGVLANCRSRANLEPDSLALKPNIIFISSQFWYKTWPNGAIGASRISAVFTQREEHLFKTLRVVLPVLWIDH